MSGVISVNNWNNSEKLQITKYFRVCCHGNQFFTTQKICFLRN